MAYASTNPYTNELLAEFPYASDAEVDAALATAQSAFESWSRLPVAERAVYVRRAAELMRERREELARIATLEMGIVYESSLVHAGTVGPGILDFYADNAEAFLAPERLGEHTLVVREPTGIVFAIEPWNAAYYQPIRATAGNLMAGNVVILKHASIVPQSSAAVARLFADAGLPAGVFTNLYATHEQTSRIIADERVRGVTMTGSDQAGRRIAAAAAAAVKPAVLELGGADAMVVLGDADIEKATDAAMSRFRMCGQICVSPKRMIVVDAAYDAFIKRFRDKAARLVPGDPLEPGVSIGPLSSQSQADIVSDQIERAVAGGAAAIPVGGRVPAHGAFVQPTILLEMDAENPVYYEEIFGPVPEIFWAKDVDDAVRIANDTKYGLGGSVFSANVELAEDVARRIDTGMVWINQVAGTAPSLPFGGTKASGYGTELGRDGIYGFVNNKLIHRP
ncbi:aldehyde dehydrogenase family protein [Microbacterium sp. NPDC077663]|uniref:aldehyde dehydrogenase family protein n=1 Tax=Microbacterium sp. NPDC077663 TaxID=3364189 RepID=UPI0037C91863